MGAGVAQRRHLVQPRLQACRLIVVIADIPVRMFDRQYPVMHQVAGVEQLVLAVGDQIGDVPRRMAGRVLGLDARRDLAARLESLDLGRDDPHQIGQFGIGADGRPFRLRHPDRCIEEGQAAIADQAADMVRVAVRDQHVGDRGRIDARLLQAVHQLALALAQARVEQHRAGPVPDQKRMDFQHDRISRLSGGGERRGDRLRRQADAEGLVVILDRVLAVEQGDGVQRADLETIDRLLGWRGDGLGGVGRRGIAGLLCVRVGVTGRQHQDRQGGPRHHHPHGFDLRLR